MDMENLDYYQDDFYDDHNPDEDFFQSMAPSEDIWKKFELVPTPPVSPVRAPEGSGRSVCPSLGDKLEWVSQFLGQEDQQQQDLPCKVGPASDSAGNLSSIIIQDCMWSCFSAGQQLERLVGERRLSCPVRLGPAGLSPGRTQGVPAHPPAALGGGAADCVDPAAVLAFPHVSCKKQVSSGSESHSDSSDDEDDQDEDEEEIDVVTLEHKQTQHKVVNARQPVTITVRADPLDPGMKHFHISIHQQQHNYAAPSPDTLPPSVEPPHKRVRREAFSPALHHQGHSCNLPGLGHAPSRLDSGRSYATEAPALNAASPASPASPSSPHLSSAQSSDCEDTDRRKAHNFLERKRRNDLRLRFLSLRDQIPGLAGCPKTPKVAILTRATEYLQQLHAGERQKSQERKQLKAKQARLLQKLAQLRRF